MSETEHEVESGTAEISQQQEKMSETEQIESGTAEISLQESEEKGEEKEQEKEPPLTGKSALLVSKTGKPVNAALAKVIKVGDRVTWNTYCDKTISPEHVGEQGLVSYVPSRYMDRHGDPDEPNECVDVRFDNGDKYCCFMGRKGQYHLQLVE